MDIPASYRVSYSRRSLHPHTSVDRQIANGRVSIRGECRVVVVEHEQGHDSGRVTPEGVEVAAAFAVVLVKVIGVAVAVALRVTGVCARAVRAR